jgi:anaerobic selenocysteine-containing dehydrogenase
MRDGAADDDLHVATACPLDCPDACSLTVSVRDGRIVEVDGGHASDVTRGYICAKVRRFPERVYGPDRVRYPMVRTGRKGSGEFARVSWDEALEKIASEITRVRETISPEAILPFCYGGSNGLLTQDAVDMVFFRRLGASRLLRTVCAAPTSAANQALYGKMPSVVYRDYPETKLLILWGVNPGVSGIHAIPYIRAAQKNGAKLVVIDPRTTPQARVADLHLAIKPGTDVVVALAVHRYLFENGYADQAFLDAHTTGAELLRTKAAEWTFERAAEVAGVGVADLLQLAHWYAGSSPALVRCGWGLERNRNGGNASLAVLALPAVGGKFGVRGGGYAMSNSAAWGLTRPWLDAPEPPTRAINMNQLGEVLTEPPSPPVSLLFVYNCNPAATIPDQARVLRGLERDDLFTVVFEQVLTDTVPYADVVLPATTFLEHYDFSKAYGPITMQLTQPVVEPIGEARSNADVFNDLGRRLDLFDEEGGRGELDSLLRVLNDLPAEVGSDLKATGVARPPWDGAPVQFVDVFPRTSDGKVHLFPADLDREAPAGLYAYQPDPATDLFPLALISPASDRTISSTLGELPRPEVRLLIHPDDASSRQIDDGEDVRIWNELGEVRCRAQVGTWIRPGTVVLPKGLWRRHTANGYTATALAPATLTDIGGGACFNDARVQVERAGGRKPASGSA